MKSELSILRQTLFVLAASLCLAIPLHAASTDWENGVAIWTDSVELENKGDYNGALEHLPSFRQITGEEYLTDLRTGWLNYLAKKYDVAITSYRRAAIKEPQALAPLLGMARCYSALNNNLEAVRAAEQAVNRRPTDYSSTQMLAALFYQGGDFKRALQYYSALLQSYPEDTATLSGYAWSQLIAGNKRDAIAAFRRLILLSADYPYAKEGYEKASSEKLNLAQP